MFASVPVITACHCHFRNVCDRSKSCVQVIKRADIFQPQNVSNTLWAFASTGFEPSDVFLEMVENHLTENISPNATAPYSAQACPGISAEASCHPIICCKGKHLDTQFATVNASAIKLPCHLPSCS